MALKKALPAGNRVWSCPKTARRAAQPTTEAFSVAGMAGFFARSNPRRSKRACLSTASNWTTAPVPLAGSLFVAARDVGSFGNWLWRRRASDPRCRRSPRHRPHRRRAVRQWHGQADDRAGEGAARNIRVFDDDATQLLDWLPNVRSVGRPLYPDPWPKKKHWKRRFVSATNLERFARVLRGAVFRFTSDVDTYVNWTMLHCRAHAAFDWRAWSDASDWHRPYPDWPGTRYEAKALREGQECRLSYFFDIIGHAVCTPAA